MDFFVKESFYVDYIPHNEDKNIDLLLSVLLLSCINIQKEIIPKYYFDDKDGLDNVANNIFKIFLKRITKINKCDGVIFISEEEKCPLLIDDGIELKLNDFYNEKNYYIITVDPLDGSNNLPLNIPLGTIFSIRHSSLKSEDIIISGYFLYGMVPTLVLANKYGVDEYIYYGNKFHFKKENIKIPENATEFACNLSNIHEYHDVYAKYINNCQRGKNGFFKRKYNMRWIATLVAELHRILVRGGVFLYPTKYINNEKINTIRLLYEAQPISFIVEKANGYASDGSTRLLNHIPDVDNIHQKISFIFGAKNDVSYIESLNKFNNFLW